MAKDPAFLLYSNDMLSGMEGLTMEERGQYITLLLLQHQKGSLSEKMIRLSVGNAAADVMAKFRQDSAGLWYNERLSKEIENRKFFTEKQRERAVEGWKKRKNKPDQSQPHAQANAAALPLEDVNEIVIEDVNENKIGDARGKIEALLFAGIGDLYLDGQRPKWQHINFDFEVNTFKEKVRGSPEDYMNHDTNGIRKAFQYQLRYAKTIQHNGNGNNKNGKQQHTSSLIEGFKARHGGAGNHGGQV